MMNPVAIRNMIVSSLASDTTFSAKLKDALRNYLGNTTEADAYMQSCLAEANARVAAAAENTKESGAAYSKAIQTRKALEKNMFVSNTEMGVSIPRADKDGKPINVVPVIEVGGNGRVVEFTECTNALVELPFEGKEAIVCRFHWKQAGYSKPPRYITVNGSVYHFLYGSNGGWKKGVAVYVPLGFYISRKDLFEAEFPFEEILTEEGSAKGYKSAADVVDELDRLSFDLNELKAKRDAAEKAIGAFNGEVGGKEHKALRAEFNKLDDEVAALKEKIDDLSNCISVIRKEGIPSKQTTQKQQQTLQTLAGCHVAARNAVVNGRPYGKDVLLTDENTIFVDENKGVYFSTVEGGVLRVDTNQWKLKDDTGFTNKGADGCILAPYGYGEAQFRAEHNGKPVAFKGYMSSKAKGDTRLDGTTVTDIWGRERVYHADMFLVNTSVWKNHFNFPTPESLFADGPISIRFCECHAKYGKIKICRQIAESVLYRATKEDLLEILAEDIGELSLYRSPAKYREAVFGEAPMLRNEALSPQWESRLWRNTILKKAANHVWNVAAGSFCVDGAMLAVVVDTDWQIDVYVGGKDPKTAGTIKAGHCILPNICRDLYGVKEGDKIVLFRTPQINLEPVIVKVQGFAAINHIEVSGRNGEYSSIALSFDYDGDKLFAIWDKAIVRCAEKAVAFCKECGLKPVVFDDLTSKEWIKSITPEHFAGNAATCGNVGKGTTPIFMIASFLTPWCKPDDTVELNDTVVTIRDLVFYGLYVNAAVTCLADEIKKGDKTTFLKSANGKKLKKFLKGFRPFSEWYDHPYERGQFTSVDGYGMTLNNDNSFSKRIVQILGEAICGDKLAFFPSILCEEYDVKAPVEKYADFLDGHGDGRGWVYNTQKDYLGLPHARWMPYTGIKEIDEDAIDGDLIEITEDDADVKAILLGNDVELRTSETPADRLRYTLDLGETDGFDVQLSLAVGRLQRVMIAIEKEDDDGGRLIRTVRNDAYARGQEAAKILVKKRYDVDLTDDQARIVLCQQLGNYLFSRWASELSGSEIAYFVSYFETELADAAKRWEESGKDDRGEKVNIWTDAELCFYDVPDMDDFGDDDSDDFDDFEEEPKPEVKPEPKSEAKISGKKVIIAGCRKFNDYDLLRRECDALLGDNIEIVSGTCSGADKLGEKYASERGYAVKRFPADWDKYGKAAGPKRNRQMAEYGEVLIAFRVGNTPGTKNMIETATKLGLDVHIVNC